MSIAEEQVEMEEDDGHQLEENDGMVVDEGIELEEEESEMPSRRATASENPKPKKAPAKRKKVQMADIIMDHGKTLYLMTSIYHTIYILRSSAGWSQTKRA